MADNTTLNSGSGGDVIATDDIAGVKHQRVKVQFGADGTANDVTSTATNPLPVALSDTDNAVLDTIDAVLDTINAKLVTGTVIGDVNLGATDNAVLDSIDTATTATQAAVEGTLTVGSHAVTNAGTFAIQVADTSFAVADGNALGEGVLVQGDDGTDRKNIHVDATTGDVQVDVTNTVTVDGSGVTQPVSGTVTANLSATDNAVLDTIDAALDTINAKLVTGTVIGDVNLGATDNAVLDSIVTNTTGLAGCVAGSELQVDIVSGGTGSTQYAEDSVHSSGNTGTMALAVRNDTLAALAGTDGDYAPLQVNAAGALFVDVESGAVTGHVDDAAFTLGTDEGIMMMGFAGTQSVDANDAGAIAMETDGSVHIHDGGNTITVDGTVTANLSATDNAVLDTIDAALDTINAKLVTGTVIGDVNLGATDNAVLDSIVTNTTGLAGCVAGSELQVDIVSGGTGSTQYAEDSVHNTGDTGTMPLAVRNDVLAALAGTDGDYSPLQVDASGSLYVTGGGGGTEYTQDAAHADPATGATWLMARDDALSTQETTDGDWTLPRANARGAQWVEIDGTNALDVSAATVTVDLGANNDVTVTSGSITADLGANNDVTIDGSTVVKAEDAVSGAGDTGIGVLAVRKATPADTSGADGDYEFIQMDNGRVWTSATIDAALPAGTNAIGKLSANSGVDIGDVDVLSSALPTGAATAAAQLADGHNVTVDNASGASAVNIQDGGNSITIDGSVTADLGANNDVTVASAVAHDAAASGQAPVIIAGRATASVEGITEVAEADSTYLNADLSGTLITRAACAHAELVSFYVANTDGAEDAVTALDDGGAAIYNFITSVTIHNAHATTNGYVELRDGSAGTVFWVFPAPALGGTTHNFNPPLRQPTISTALYVDVSAAITTMHISIAGYQGNG